LLISKFVVVSHRNYFPKAPDPTIDHNGFMWAGGLQAPERQVMGRDEGVPLYLC